MIFNKTLNAKVCNSWTIYRVLFVIFIMISRSIRSAFIYIRVKFNTNTQTTIY